MAPGVRLVFRSFGSVIQLTCDDTPTLAAARAMLPPGWRSADGETPSVSVELTRDGIVTIDGTPTVREPDRRSALLRLGAEIRHHLATESLEHVFVHAGVVSWDGVGIVLPGRSHTGKSRLVAELVGLGATYYSDEYAVVQANGTILAFAKPLSIRRPGDRGFGELVPVPAARIGADPIRCGLIAVTSFRPESEWRPEVWSASEGALALLQNTVCARRRPAATLRMAAELARGALVLGGDRGEADVAALALSRATASSPRGETLAEVIVGITR